MTYEELIASGFDNETAKTLSETSGSSDTGGLSAPMLKLNYDTKDILIDEGIKKGNFIAGWKIDNQTLSIKEKGEDLGNELEFIVVSSVYQCDHFDITTGSTSIITDIFYSSYDTRKMVDKKSGKTIGELKDAGQKVKFNNILLLLVKTKDGYKPYIHYMHGVSYSYWSKALTEENIDNQTLQYNFKVKSKKVATAYQPAWVLDLVSAKKRTAKEIQESIPVVSEAIKDFNKWIKATNSGSSIADSNKAAGAVGQTADIEIDISDSEIPF